MSPSPSQTADPSALPTSLPKSTSPLFVQPSKTPEHTPPSPTPEYSHDGSPDQTPAEAPWSTDTPGSASGPAPGESSDTPSSGSGVKLSKAGLRAALGVGFRQVCRTVASFVADQDQREAGLWTPDDDDVKDVSTPAANIVYRRLPDEAKGGDVIDLFALGLALVGYVGKNLALRAELRTLRQLQEAQGIQPEQE
ncbi:hypothetical protein [Streptomyces sp. NRRL S-146]|uniref:hypothetical protein n=1 Tax=Streptomyces sp. NRRL S-146 TaxID=1463884 RepID=UPI00131ADF06|nr:hypothetical protein [Streptomyces sp. NRRL S-146]